MTAIGIGQTELARRVGVKQPTIFKLINGQRYGTTYIHRIARELGTTASYLTGETDDPDVDASPIPELGWKHRQLIDCFNDLDDEDQAALLRIAHTMAGKRPTAPTVHAPSQEYRHESA